MTHVYLTFSSAFDGFYDEGSHAGCDDDLFSVCTALHCLEFREWDGMGEKARSQFFECVSIELDSLSI